MAKYVDCYDHQREVAADLQRRRRMRIAQVREQERLAARQTRSAFLAKKSENERRAAQEIEVHVPSFS